MRSYSKYIKRVLAVVLALSVLSVSVQPVPAEAKKTQSKADLEKKKQNTLNEIKKLKGNIDKTKKEIDSLTIKKSTIQDYISALDKESAKLSKDIANFEGKIGKKEKDIETTKAELEEAKADCDAQYDFMKRRIQFMYENPPESVLEALVSSRSIADFLTRADKVSALSQYDRQMMENLAETKEKIEFKEETLEAEREELQMMRDAVAAQKKKVNSSINQKKGELNDNQISLDNAKDEKSDYAKQLKKQEKLLNQIEDQIAQAAKNVYEGKVTGFIWPCPSYTRISSGFGPRPQPTPGASTYHRGLDMAAPYGSNILASAAGIVTTSSYSSSAGNYIVISHGNGISTVYMHASSLLVSAGQVVSQGQVIAKVGSTGYSTGNHLHFGVIKNGSYVNPTGYVSP